jgi:acyl-CoA dehydrogenase
MISFDLSEEQKMIKDMVADFATNELRNIARDCDENGEVPEALVKKFHELSLLRNMLPEEFGGYGAERSVLSGAIVAEEMAWGDLSLAIHLLSPSLFALPVLEKGTEEQKKKYIPPFCTDECKAGTMAVMEPRMTFDPGHLFTTAVREENDYVINGEKCFTPLGGSADLFLIFAATAKGAGYPGVDGFIVEKGTSGLTVKEREKNMGLKALETNEITLQECRVPKENRLGGERPADFQKLINYCRIGLAAMAVGVARASFEYARDYAKERVAFGEPIASRQAIAFMLAEMAIEIDATRLMTWEAAWKMDRGDNATREAYLTKRYASDMALKVTDWGVQILGGHGYIREHPVELWFRNGRGFATLEGMVMI